MVRPRLESSAIGISAAVFLSGAVLLGLELVASRVLAPFFGNSIFVWGSLIGVVLAGLAVGYWVGGVLADRTPAPQLLLVVLALGAGATLLIPVVDDPLLEAVVGWDPGPRWNPLVAAVALFGLPSVILATATPIAVRLRARSLTSLGKTAGRLFALSTAGSIAGTFATAFFLIPEVGTNQLLGMLATGLFVAAGLVALGERMLLTGVALAALVAASVAATFALAPDEGRRLSGAAAENWSPLIRQRGEQQDVIAPAGGFDLVYSKNTRYHGLSVVEDGESRHLRFDSSFQSGMYLANPFRTRYKYTDYLQLPLAYNPGARKILFIGLGGGSLQKRMWRDFPDVDQQVVELDPVVRDVAYRYFKLPRSPRVRVTVEDGRRFLQQHDERWDAIVIDAYFSDSLPFHLTTLEFVELARSRLAPGGVIAGNLIGAVSGEGSKLFRAMYKTYRAVFPTVVVHPVREQGDADGALRNLIVVAGDGAAPGQDALQRQWRRLRARSPKAADLTKAIRDRHESLIATKDVPLLTDDFAPTDSLLFLD
ncbi:MAG: fused MFS/spermidine synthase [Actinobacteria bacterium]|nr:fused MFS/spermidine synthase [Actinomycetota bacterium]